MAGEPILVVDDNQLNLKLIHYILLRNGYEVRTATSADEAQEVLKTFHPLVILMDVQLPGIDGLTLTRMLKDDPATRDIVIIAVTAFAMIGDAERVQAAGCDGYITKPIDNKALVRTVAQHARKE